MSKLGLDGSPYLLDALAESTVLEALDALEERVNLLRRHGTLTDDTLRQYYGERRFEQVAESNAIEGSTLSSGETELAVQKGITLTGHDPAYVRDARALDSALQRLSELARETGGSTDIDQLLELHALILEGRPGAGLFRNQAVRISGSSHRPPRDWREVIEAMEHWETWSKTQSTIPAPIRAAVLHAWLAHIHPFTDGNGRTARAIGNLELVRAGYPPIIIKKKERDRYIEALGESDEGGDIRSFLELTFERCEAALTGLELAAKKQEGYSAVQEKIRQRQERQLSIWATSVDLLAKTLEYFMEEGLAPVGGGADVRVFESPIDIDEYVTLCEGKSVSRSWAFICNVQLPGLPRFEILSFIGHRSASMYRELSYEGGPSIFWSERNPEGYPKWRPAGNKSPYAMELTISGGSGDEWFARHESGDISRHRTTELAKKIAEELIKSASE